MKSDFVFGEWLPDQPKLGDGLELCQGVVAQPEGYNAYPAAGATVASITGTPIGARTFKRTDGTEVVCVGTTSNLYVIISGTATATLHGASLANTDSWVFEQFGSAIYATNLTVGLMYLTDVDSDTSWSAAPGSPPKAKCMARVGDFLVLGHLENEPFRIQWSRYNNPQGTWGTDIATQAGYDDLEERYGPVTGITSGSTAIVFQEEGFSRLAPGGITAFQRQIVEEGRGAAGPGAFIEFGPATYFVANDGIFRTTGGPAQNLAVGKCWNYFRDFVTAAVIPRVKVAVDWTRRCILFTADSVTRALAYNVDTDRFTEVYLDDEGDAGPIISVTGSNDILTIGGFVAGNFVKYETNNATINITTRLFQPNPEGRAFFREIWPVIMDGNAGVTIAMRTYDTYPSSTDFTSEAAPTYFHAMNLDGRYFAIEMSASATGGGKDGIVGVRFDWIPSGVF